MMKEFDVFLGSDHERAIGKDDLKAWFGGTTYWELIEAAVNAGVTFELNRSVSDIAGQRRTLCGFKITFPVGTTCLHSWAECMGSSWDEIAFTLLHGIISPIKQLMDPSRAYVPFSKQEAIAMLQAAIYDVERDRIAVVKSPHGNLIVNAS